MYLCFLLLSKIKCRPPPINSTNSSGSTIALSLSSMLIKITLQVSRNMLVCQHFNQGFCLLSVQCAILISIKPWKYLIYKFSNFVCTDIEQVCFFCCGVTSALSLLMKLQMKEPTDQLISCLHLYGCLCLSSAWFHFWNLHQNTS